MGVLLKHMDNTLRLWSDRHIGSIKLQQLMAKEIIFQLNVVQESRQLSQKEFNLRKELKLKLLGLASLKCIIPRQPSASTS